MRPIDTEDSTEFRLLRNLIGDRSALKMIRERQELQKIQEEQKRSPAERIEEIKSSFNEPIDERELDVQGSDVLPVAGKGIKTMLAAIGAATPEPVPVGFTELSDGKKVPLMLDPLSIGSMKNVAKGAIKKVSQKANKEILNKVSQQPQKYQTITDDYGDLQVIKGNKGSAEVTSGRYGFENVDDSLSSNPLQIQSLEIDPSARGKGFGSDLLREVENQAVNAGHDGVVLRGHPLTTGFEKTTAKDIERVRNFYKKNGYKHIGFDEMDPQQAIFFKDLQPKQLSSISAEKHTKLFQFRKKYPDYSLEEAMNTLNFSDLEKDYIRKEYGDLLD